MKSTNKIKKLNKDCKIEVLIPDFKGDENALKNVIKSNPEVINHNIEVVKELLARNMIGIGSRSTVLLGGPRRLRRYTGDIFIDARSPIYLEYMVDIGEKIKEITKEIGLDVDFTQYTPLISWTPCSIHRKDNPEYDLYCFSYRDVLHTGSHTMEQPWLDEASRMNPYTYNIAMNADTAKRKGLKDGDTVVLESIAGRKVQADSSS
jgi:anaerobic selenocysteine-containing dehydrogenase